MSNTIEITNWDEALDFLGHASIHPPLEEFIVKTLKLKKFPTAIDTFLRTFNRECVLHFDLNYNETYLLPQKSLGNYVLEWIEIGNSYKGNLPFGLDFSMSHKEIIALFSEHFLEDRRRENNSLISSVFYHKSLKLIIVVFYERATEGKRIDSIRFTVPTIYHKRDYHINL